MRNPRTLKELSADPRVDSVHWEYDGYGDTVREENLPSLWVSFNEGWSDHRGESSIHTKTIKEACRRMRDFHFDPSRV